MPYLHSRRTQEKAGCKQPLHPAIGQWPIMTTCSPLCNLQVRREAEGVKGCRVVEDASPKVRLPYSSRCDAMRRSRRSRPIKVRCDARLAISAALAVGKTAHQSLAINCHHHLTPNRQNLFVNIKVMHFRKEQEFESPRCRMAKLCNSTIDTLAERLRRCTRINESYQ